MAADRPRLPILSIPKEGERIIAPTQRPDGTLRKAIRIRSGHVPQDEVAIYQSKGALLRKANEPEVPPGYDPALAEKLKTKSAKRNEGKKKKKRLQVALYKIKDSKTEKVASADMKREESVEVVTEQISRTSVSDMPEVVSPSIDTVEIPEPETSSLDLPKKIRALKKKIRLAEAKLQGNQQSTEPEHTEKMQRVKGWRKELKLLEDRNADSMVS